MKISPLLLIILIIASLNVSATTYEVSSDSEFIKVPWLSLVAGDQVRIHWKEQPYRFKIGIRGRGTKSQPIRIIGIPGGTDGKQLPVLSGENAVTDDQFNGFFSTIWDESMALIMIKQAGATEKPGYIIIENLKIIKTKLSSSYIAMDGSVHHFGDSQDSGYEPDDFTSAIMANPVEHLVVRGCEITDNSQAIFVMSKGDEAFTSRDILIERNIIDGNGVANDSHEHNIYTEAIGTTIQYNYLGRLRDNAEGSTLKDRSAGTVIRYNRIESSARAIDIVEAEEGYPILSLDKGYHSTHIYGNVIVNNVSQPIYSNRMIHYGYDNEPNSARMGPHYFYNNTVVITGSGNPQWGISVFQCGTDWGTKAKDNLIEIELQNNIFYWNPTTVQYNGIDGGMYLMNSFGKANMLGTNWISQDWQPGRYDFYGEVVALGTLLKGDYPGFQDETNGKYDLSSTSILIDKGTILPDSIVSGFPLTAMYKGTADSTSRKSIGKAIDLGAFEYGIMSETPTNLSLHDTIISGGTTKCFNAYDSLIVAVNSNIVQLQSGSSVELIAGKSIRFLPGFHANEGCFAHAYITTDSSFCREDAGSIVQNLFHEKSREEGLLFIPKDSSDSKKVLKIYPNPNRGSFTLETENMNKGYEVYIYNSIGSVVYQSLLHGQIFQKINLEGIKRGLYVVNVNNGKETVVKKIMVN